MTVKNKRVEEESIVKETNRLVIFHTSGLKLIHFKGTLKYQSIKTIIGTEALYASNGRE